MHKMIVIFLGVFGCLLFSTDGRNVFAYSGEPSVVMLSVDRASDAQWLCERECNADLNLTRIVGEASSAPVTTAFQRGGCGDVRHAVDRHAADRGGMGIARVNAEFKTSDLSIGLHAVDYYVYRLRRLII